MIVELAPSVVEIMGLFYGGRGEAFGCADELHVSSAIVNKDGNE